jgi:hypothetical protein
LGARVIAVDIDEASANHLYRRTRRERRDIVPLVADVMAPEEPVEAAFPIAGAAGPISLLLPRRERLRSEAGMALALVHHLVLGQGHTPGSVVAALSRLVERHLIVEFVPKHDALVRSEPSFFPALRRDPGRFAGYTEEALHSELLGHFDQVEVVPSHPEPRRLLLCSR